MGRLVAIAWGVGGLVVVVVLGFAVLSNPALTAAGPAATATPDTRTAYVEDLSVPFADSEADALVPQGFEGSGPLGRLQMGCAVQVLKVTARAARVRVDGCDQSDGMTPPKGSIGWVAKSALSEVTPPS